MTALVRILSYARVDGRSKMVAYNRKCLRNNVYLSLYTNAVIMHDLKNLGIAVGIMEFCCYHVYKLRYNTLFLNE